MAYLNANIPVIECWVRGNFLRDQKDSHDKYFEVGVFGFSSIPNRVPMFHFLMEDECPFLRDHLTEKHDQ